MSRIALKKKLSQELVTTAYEDLFVLLQGYPSKSLINPLFSFICSGDKDLRWRAISGFGEVLGRMAVEDLEAARIIMRRFLWSLNDESGGIGWGAPETMAEAMVHSDVLRKEYLHMLLSYAKEDGEELYQDGNHLELPMLQEGLLWGIARVAENYPNEVMAKGFVKDLLPYLKSENSEVVLHTLRILGHLHVKELSFQSIHKKLPEVFAYYESGKYVKVSTAKLLVDLS